MIAVVLSLLMNSSAALPSDALPPQRLLWPTRMVASESESGDDGFRPVVIDGKAGTTRWRRARATYVLPETIEGGAWLLSVGRPGLAAQATLAGEPLAPADDSYAADPMLRCGPRFLVPSLSLRSGEATIDLVFSGGDGGRGLERGPAWLASPGAAARARAAATTGGLALAVANFATLGTLSKEHELLSRILFKYAADRDEPTLAAQLDLTLENENRSGALAVAALSGRRSGAFFPTSFADYDDDRMKELNTQIALSAPTLTTPLRLSDAKALYFDLGQALVRESFDLTWNLHFFPAIGGALRVVRTDDQLLLCNDVVGIYASDATLLGDESAPVGLALRLNSEARSSTLSGIAGPAVRCGIVGFEPGGDDPSQADSIEDLAASMLDHRDEDRAATAMIAGTIPSEPNLIATPMGLITRKSMVATLAAMRRRGRRFCYVPPGGAQSAEAYWSDTFTLFQFPAHERGAVEQLLATQEDDGSILGDLPAAADDAERAAADAYTVLRACRWLRWVYDGDRFLGMVPKLERALDHADACDLSRPAPAALSAAIARAAAHRALAGALEQIGARDDLVARSNELATTQTATLFAPTSEGGRFGPDGFVPSDGGDPRDAAAALAFELTDELQAALLAKQLSFKGRRASANDWRDGLVLRGLLTGGQLKAAAEAQSQLEEQIRALALPLGSGAASYHGIVCYGLLGIRRENLGTLELRPRLVGDQVMRSAVRLPEGAVRFSVEAANAQRTRRFSVTNDSQLDLMVRLGIPDALESEGAPRVQVGELVHAMRERIVPQKQSWRETVR